MLRMDGGYARDRALGPWPGSNHDGGLSNG